MLLAQTGEKRRFIPLNAKSFKEGFCLDSRVQVRPTFFDPREVVNDVMAKNALVEERRYGTVANITCAALLPTWRELRVANPAICGVIVRSVEISFNPVKLCCWEGEGGWLGLDKKTKDLLLLERSFSIVQSERDDLNKKCNQLRHERDKFSTNLRDLELEHEKLLKLLEDKTNRLNEETILRVELENTVTTLKEDLEFKRNMYEQTLKESTTRRLIEISEVDAGVADYEARLKIDLQETRQLYEQQMEENRKEMEELFRQQSLAKK
uniref:IF rod domain-containing protein n=1 Tax=Timema cristinae TaxID=61476 RepID=A0A7R9D8S9_TIMCR|nr:unnamed protein product [Timema cristinae]